MMLDYGKCGKRKESKMHRLYKPIIMALSITAMTSFQSSGGNGKFNADTGEFDFKVSILFDANQYPQLDKTTVENEVRKTFQRASAILAQATGKHKFGRVTILHDNRGRDDAEFVIHLGEGSAARTPLLLGPSTKIEPTCTPPSQKGFVRLMQESKIAGQKNYIVKYIVNYIVPQDFPWANSLKVNTCAGKGLSRGKCWTAVLPKMFTFIVSRHREKGLATVSIWKGEKVLNQFDKR